MKFKFSRKWLFLILILLLLFLPSFFVSIQIHGEKNMEIPYGSIYEELGADAFFFGKKMHTNIHGVIDTKKLGKQEVTYSISNFFGIMKKAKRKVVVRDLEAPVLTLLGNEKVTLLLGEVYQEAGYTLIDNVDKDITDKVKISGHVDTEKVGVYELVYQGKDSSQNVVTKKRIVEVVQNIVYQSAWNQISNQGKSWWSGNKKNNTRPETGSGASSIFLKQYDAYYMGKDEKVIYLTFDIGSDNTYTKQIADILYQNGIRATFFVCGNYVKNNADIMKQLVSQGHSVGNHTFHHHAMYDYADEKNFQKFISEIKDVEDAFYQVTGTPLDKVYREPRGEYSERTLKIMQSMGYKTIFWSADYYDFAYDVSASTALNNYMQRYHNGAIFLIHPSNKGNYEAMDTFVKNLKKLGYTFGLVKDIS